MTSGYAVNLDLVATVINIDGILRERGILIWQEPHASLFLSLSLSAAICYAPR